MSSLKKNKLDVSRIQYGRQRIILDYDEVTLDNLFDVLQDVITIHKRNANDCDYLINYFLGDQDILNKQPCTTNNINNQVVVNYAFPITREIVGYTLGNAVELLQKDIKFQDDVNKLSDIYDYETSYHVDVCSAIYASICGVGYQITLPSKYITKDNTPDVPILYDYLDPRYTFVAQSSSVGNPQILSGYYIKNKKTGKYEYTCFNDKYKFEFIYGEPETLVTTRNVIGLDPITMIENSLFLTGDWEQAIAVMNASNQVASNTLDDIEGTIKSLLVVIGAEFEDDSDIDNVKTKRVLTLTRGSGDASNLDAKFIAPSLDSVSVENIREYLEDARNVITGIPDRSANSSGGDTGTAVLNRDGWTDIEIVARLKELFFKKGKKKQLAIGMKILQMLDIISDEITPMDINLSIGRHTTDNLTTKTQAFSTLVATGKLATIDCLELSNLTNKTREMVERGEKEAEERQKKQQELMQENNTNKTQDNEDITQNNKSENDNKSPSDS